MNHVSTLMMDMENPTEDRVSKSNISAHFLNKAEEEIPLTTINIDCNTGEDQTIIVYDSK